MHICGFFYASPTYIAQPAESWPIEKVEFWFVPFNRPVCLSVISQWNFVCYHLVRSEKSWWWPSGKSFASHARGGFGWVTQDRSLREFLFLITCLLELTPTRFLSGLGVPVPGCALLRSWFVSVKEKTKQAEITDATTNFVRFGLLMSFHLLLFCKYFLKIWKTVGSLGCWGGGGVAATSLLQIV